MIMLSTHIIIVPIPIIIIMHNNESYDGKEAYEIHTGVPGNNTAAGGVDDASLFNTTDQGVNITII